MSFSLLDYYGHRGTPSLQPGGSRATKLLLNKLPSGRGRLLEFGCGTGHSLIASADRGWMVTGLDVSLVMLGQARSRLGFAGTWCDLLQIGTTGELPFADVSFDAAYCESVLAILQPEQLKRVLTELRLSMPRCLTQPA